MSEPELAALPNLGPASARWLVSAGIGTVAELRRAATANLLYALYAALEDKHWTEVTQAEKADLRRGAGLDDVR